MEFIKNSALVVIDSQNEFVNWLPEEVNGPQVVKNIRKVIDAFHEAENRLFFSGNCIGFSRLILAGSLMEMSRFIVLKAQRRQISIR